MNIFCTSHTFVPLANAEAIQSARILERLRLDKHNVAVFTAAPDDAGATGGDERPLFTGEVERYKGREYRWGMRIGRRLVPLVASVPDEFVFWFRTARRAALSAAERFAPDVVYSRSQPFTSALTGAWVANKLGIPHVANFSDPWVSNPFARHGKIGGMLNRRLERSVVQSAARVITTTSWLEDDLVERYGESLRKNISVLPHSFEPAAFEGRNRIAHEGYVLSHIGNLYGARTAVPVVAAVNQLVRDGVLPVNTRIRLVGFVDKGEADSIRSVDRSGLVEIVGRVNYERSLQEMVSADVLLSIDGPGAASHPFLPSKIIEYIGARKQIVAIAEPGSASQMLAAELGAETASPSNITAISGALRRSVEAGTPSYRAEITAKYTVGTVASNLAEILSEVAVSRV